MRLLVINVKKAEDFDSVVQALNQEGLNGIVLASTSVHNALHHESVEEVPSFGFLSKLGRRNLSSGHTMMVVVDDDKYESAKKAIKSKVPSFAGKGIMFGLPIDDFERLNSDKD